MKKFSWLLVVALVTLACKGLTGAPGAPIPTTAPASATEIVPAAIAPQASETTAPATDVPAVTQDEVAGEKARQHLAYLSDELGQRVAGSQTERQARDYIAGQFESFGYVTEVQEFSVTEDDGGDSISLRSANVIALKPGRSQREIIVGAHYDSTDDAGLGADDNASAVGVMLEAAERIQALETPFTIRFIAFGSEEINLNGSATFVSQMTRAEIDNTIAMINLDSLAAGDNTYIYSDEGQKARLRDWTLTWAGQNSLDLQTIRDVDLTYNGYGISDHFAFQQVGIPFVYFEATNWNLGDQDGYTQVAQEYGEDGKVWHTRYDTLAYLDETFPGRVDAHLNLFTRCLLAILTQYEE